MLAHLALDHGDNLVNDVVDVQPGFLRVGFLRERAHPPDHLARPVRIPDHALHGDSCLIQVRGLACKSSQAGITVGDDGGERLVDLVSDGGRQLAHGRHRQ